MTRPDLVKGLSGVKGWFWLGIRGGLVKVWKWLVIFAYVKKA